MLDLSEQGASGFSFPNGPVDFDAGVAYTSVASSPYAVHKEPSVKYRFRGLSPGYVLRRAHRSIIKGLRPRDVTPNMIAPALCAYSTAVTIHGIAEGAPIAKIESSRGPMNVVPTQETLVRFRHPVEFTLASDEFLGWLSGEGGEISPQLMTLAATVYRSLYKSEEGEHSSFYLMFHGSESAFDFNRGWNFSKFQDGVATIKDVFITVKLTSNPHVHGIEIMHIASRISHLLRSFLERYTINLSDFNIEFYGFTIRQLIPGNFSSFSHVIRGYGLDILKQGLLAEDYGVRIKFKYFNKFMKERGLHMVSPKTTRNCFVACAYGILHGEIPTEGAELRKFTSKVSEFARRHAVGESVNMHDLCFKLTNSRAFFGRSIDVLNWDLTVIGHIGDPGMAEGFIWVHAGHAYALMPGELIIPEEGFELILPKPIVQHKMNIVIYDLETTQEMHTYAAGWVTQDGVYMESKGEYSIEQMLYAVESKYCQCRSRKIYYYAINGGCFDSYEVCRCLRNTSYVATSLLDKDGRFLDVEWCDYSTSPPFRHKFRDVYPLMPASLKYWGEAYNSPHQKLDTVDHTKIHDHNWEAEYIRQDVGTYLMYDVLTLRDVFEAWRAECVDIVGYDPVLAGCLTSPSIVRKLLMAEHYDPVEYPIYTIPYEIEKRFKKSLHGGNTDVYRRGVYESEPDKDLVLKYLDAVSLYPSVLVQCGIPYDKPWVVNEEPPYSKHRCGCFRIEVEGGHEHLNLFRVKHPDLGLLSCRFAKPTKIWVYSEEYYFAKEHNDFFGYTKLNFLWGYASKRGKWLKDITMKFYKMKQKTPKSQATKYRQVKERLNSIWGFMGQRRFSMSMVICRSPEKLSSLYTLGEVVEFSHPFAYVKTEIPATFRHILGASAVTSEARLKMMRYEMAVYVMGYRLFYTDTDSVIVDAPIEVLEMGGPVNAGLGSLIPEIDNVIRVACIAPKIKAITYLDPIEGEKTEITLKGISHKKLNLSFRDIAGLLNGRPIRQKMFRIVAGKRKLLNRTGDYLKAGMHEIVVNGAYRKGTIREDGYRETLWISKRNGDVLVHDGPDDV